MANATCRVMVFFVWLVSFECTVYVNLHNKGNLGIINQRIVNPVIRFTLKWPWHSRSISQIGLLANQRS